MTILAVPPSLTAGEEIAGRSLWQDALARLLRNRAAVVSLVLLAIIALLAVFAPLLSPHPFDEVYFDEIGAPPNFAKAHWFGTDANGRDLFVRTLYGARVSLAVGLAATAVSLVIGVTYGAIAGYIGGRVDNTMARIVRGQTLSIKRREFVEAALAGGVSTAKIIRRHIIPNSIGPVIVYVTLTIPQVILIESFLSFLGLGVQEPYTSWGVLISEGAAQMETAPWMLVFPAFFLATTLFCFNFIGDGLRDALDPKDR